MPNIRRMIPRCLLIGLLLGLGFPWPDTIATAQGPDKRGIPDSYTRVGENDTFELYADPATLAFKAVDKRSGYIWHSNLDEVTREDSLNRTWSNFARSGISIDFLDDEADDERVSITNGDHELDFKPIDQGFEAMVTFTEPSITLAVKVQLEADGVRVEVPFKSIKEEDPEARLGLLHLYPFMGAVREDSVPGYMFIPDGAGTLIRFADKSKARNMFLGRYYGADLGMTGVMPLDPEITRPFQISIPVIGMVHSEEEHAFIAVVEKGASYGEIRAHPAGVNTKFNFLYNTFVYNQAYFQATNRSGEGVTTLQPATNEFDIVVHYRLLTGDQGNYVGMARSYQDYLVDRGDLKERLDPGNDIGIKLEFLGAEKERILFWHRSIPVTTISQMSNIFGDLDVKNPDVVYYGWQPRGANALYPSSVSLDATLGTRAQLASFATEVTAANGRLYLYVDPQAALRHVRGYSGRNELALAITNVNVAGYNRFKENYYFNMQALRERLQPLSRAVANDLGAGLALDGIGSTLYSDFKGDRVLNREATIPMYQELVAEAGANTAFYLPNDYMFRHMRAYYDMPLANSGYLFTTEVVPFLQIALGGYVPMYGRPLNFSPNLRADMLRHVDFGVYPSFFLTHAPTSAILNTSSGWIFSSSYEQWGQKIKETYTWLNNLLSAVKGERVVARETLRSGVVATTYSNGQQIVVNYNSAPFSKGSLYVGPEDAIIREVTP